MVVGVTFDAESKSAEMPKSHLQGRGVGLVVGDQLPTFDAESKSAKITKSNLQGEGGLVFGG